MAATAAAESLAALHAALRAERVTLITPNRRLAAYHQRNFEISQQSRGLAAWPTPDILPFTTFVERTWRALSLAGVQATAPSSAAGESPPLPLQSSPQSSPPLSPHLPPRLIDALQSQLLWEQIIRKSDTAQANGLMNIPQTARQAASAWTLAHSWQLFPAMQKFALHDDATMFLAWSRRYRESCREKNVIDVALLPDALAALLAIPVTTPRAADNEGDKNGALLPQRILLAGFDIATPQQHHLWRAFREAGIAVDAIEPADAPADASVTRIEFANDTEELRACATWARRRLEKDPDTRIAIVVPDLEGKRGRITRELTDALLPTARAQGAAGAESTGSALINISLGEPLGDYALVSDALAMLELSLLRPVPFLTASALLRSPFIAGAEREMAGRARLDAMLREHAALEIGLPALQRQLTAEGRIGRAAASCGMLVSAIENVLALTQAAHGAQQGTQQATQSRARGRKAPAAPHEWSRHFGQVLTAWGFPGERPLDSMDYQVLGKFRDALTTLATLATVQPRMRGDEALLQLRRIVADTMFQPESAHGSVAPIQVLGILESAGQTFDALWVTGLSDEAWPLTARPNPFIPAGLQRAAGVPEASAVASLALDARITEGWRNGADEVIVSHARVAEGGSAAEQERSASALIRDIAPTALVAWLGDASSPGYAAALQAIGTRETIPDEVLNALPAPTAIRGGAAVMRDQAACPFRAFARHRLGAKPLDAPVAGPDAMDRGNLLHRVLYLVWGRIENHERLVGLDAAATSDIVNAAATQAIAEALNDSVANLTGRYAEIEHARLCRIVIEWLAYERERTPFTVVGREAARKVTLAGLSMDLRLDRMDRLADGTHALIDYKTGVAKLASWLGTRPDEPQLPLYCHTADEAISALAFARVKRGERGKVFGFEGLSVVEGLLPDVAPVETKTRLQKLGYASWDVLLEEWDTTMNALAQGFSRGDATVDPKRGGITCGQCDLQSVCRIAEVGRYAALAVDAGAASAESIDATGFGDADAT